MPAAQEKSQLSAAVKSEPDQSETCPSVTESSSNGPAGKASAIGIISTTKDAEDSKIDNLKQETSTKLSENSNFDTNTQKQELSANSAAPLTKPAPKTNNYDIEMDLDSVAHTPFVNKVWLIVNNPDNHQYIRWVPGGKSILIVDREGFERHLLPYHFKHKRFTSFVRQLNMYGWHKVQDLSSGTMQGAEENWQFANPNFIQGHPELLKNIIRNKGSKAQAAQAAQKQEAQKSAQINDNSGPNNQESKQDLKAILYELSQIRMRQQSIGEDLARVRKDNELLWNEYYQTRERHDKHSQVLGRILRFLATIYGNQSKILGFNDPVVGPIGPNGIDTQHPGPGNQYLNLLPSNEQTDSGIRELREIELLQHEIDEANTPGSTSGSSSLNESNNGTNNSNGYKTQPVYSSYSGSNSSNSSNLGQLTNTTTVLSPANRAVSPISRALIKPRHHGSQHLPSSNISSNFRVTSKPPKQKTPCISNDHVISDNCNPSSSLSTANNQLVRAIPHHVVHQNSMSPHQVPISYQQPSTKAPAVQEICDELPEADPAQLFPELGDFPQAPPLTAQELEQISKEVATNGMSLQYIQDWLSKQNLESDDHFNVDDFLATDDGAVSGTDSTDKTKSKSVGEPDSKRVRVQ